MAVTATHLDHGNTSGSSWATASKSPSTNKLQLLAVNNTNNSTGTAQTPTVTGCGLTWVQVGTTNTSRGGIGQRLTLFRALGTPTTGTLTIDFGGTSNLGQYSWTEFGNVDTTGTNGSGAVVQAPFNGSGDGNVSVSMAAYGSSNNATFGAVGTRFTHATNTAGSGFTELSAEECQGDYCLEAQWKSTGSVSTVTWGGSNGSATNWYTAIGTEIKFAPPTSLPPDPRRSLRNSLLRR